MITRLIFSCLALCLVSHSVAVGAERPNILFIMSDDHATNGLGCYGGRLAGLNPTPTLDRLASEGVRFDNCFCSNSICTPSRATLMTGRYSHHPDNGVRTLQGNLPGPQQTLAHNMKRAGYQTAMIGKWHLYAEPAAFDYYYVLEGQGKYHNPKFLVRGPRPYPENVRHPAEEKYDSIHSSDAITDASIAWLSNRKSDKPFFLMHHFKAPHDNFENAERYDWLFTDKTIPEPANLNRRGNHGPPGAPRHGTSVSRRNTRRNMGHHMTTPTELDDEAYTAETYQRYLKKYLRCVRGLDDNIARLLKTLESMGQLDNTLIVYTSDQGFMLGEHDYIDKRWIYEESLRMPLIAWGPGVEAGVVRSEMITNVDFMPTLLALADAPIDANESDGESFAPMLAGREVPGWRDAVYYRYWMHRAHHDVPAHYGLRTRDYKLSFFYGMPLDAAGATQPATPPYWELYDLRSDPTEDNNLVTDPGYAETLRQLKQQLYDLKREVGDSDEQYPELTAVAEKAL